MDAGLRSSLEISAEAGADFPLSSTQRGFWLDYQLHPERRGSSNPALCLRVFGPLDPEGFQRALDLLVARHPMLRAHFVEIGAEPKQRVRSRACAQVTSLASPDLSDSALRQRLIEDYARPFDLSEAPLVRATLYRRANEDWVLLLVFEHLVCDAWSFWRLIQELDLILSGEGELYEESSSYLDYVREQALWLGSAKAEKQLAHWRMALAGNFPSLSLPEAMAPPQKRFGARGSAYFILAPDLADSLNALASKHGCTLYAALLTGYFILMHRLTGEGKLSVGSVMPGRVERKWRDVVGNFINLVCLRVSIEPGMTVSDLLCRVRGVAKRAVANQAYPFAELAERLAPRRDRGRHPYFQTLFGFQNARGASTLAGLVASDAAGRPISFGGHLAAQFWRASNDGAEAFDIALDLIELDRSIAGAFNYAADLFVAETVERYIGYFRQILEAMAHDDSVDVDRLPLLDEAARLQAIKAARPNVSNIPLQICAHEIFEAQAAQTPTSTAISYKGVQLTYAELDERANRVAHHLRRIGAQPESIVAFCGEREPSAIIALLAIWKAGAAYAPLDPTHPVERLATMLKDARPIAVLTTKKASSALSGQSIEAPIIEVEAIAWSEGVSERSEPAETSIGEDSSLAYVVYTSGSTGQPKGVMVEHRQLVSVLQAMRGLTGLRAGDRMLALTTLAFDIAALDIWLPLICGGEVVLCERSASLDPRRLSAIIDQEKITHLQATPATWRMLVDSGWGGADGLIALCGGEALPTVLAQRIRERVGALWNLYGPTETTIWSSASNVFPDFLQPGVAPIGRPLTNSAIHLLDEFGEPAPIGVRAEIYIGGEGVCRGYLNQPAKTAERFLPDFFTENDDDGSPCSARLFRTGDFGRRRADGTIEFLGRDDGQVKIRGFRVELGEIEARLATHPDLRATAAAVHEGAAGERSLVAYYVPTQGAGPSADELRAYLGSALPAYMIPQAFVRLSRLPLTPNGKLDRSALPWPAETQKELGEAYDASPANQLEAAVARIWQETLGVTRVGRNDDFFALGGHSLAAAAMVSRLRETLNHDADVATIFAASTLAEFAARLEEDGAKAAFEGGSKSLRAGPDPHIICFSPRPRPESLRPTIFAVGNAKIFRPLALKLEEIDQPFYVVRPLESELPDVLARPTLEEVAAFYLGLLRRAQPKGRYVLFGFCATAALAFEMARQSGEQAALVVLVEAWAPGQAEKIGRASALLARVIYGLRRRLWLLRGWPRASWRERLFVILQMTPYYGRVRRRLEPPEARSETGILLQRLHNHLVHVANNYRPALSTRPILVIRGETHPQVRGMSPSLGWSDFTAGPIHVVTANGDHDAMFSPENVETLARILATQNVAQIHGASEF